MTKVNEYTKYRVGYIDGLLDAKQAIEALEAKPESCASGCSPAGRGGGLSEAGRSPDRLTIPKLISFIKDDLDKPLRQGLSVTYNGAWNACCEYFVQQLEELDKGGVEMAGQDAPE